ncbi:Dps family protein [Actinophytocola sp.]|uniref:Dps family protein n=1 Tax=Actinophytocola sp. TaxID=1872138 RepID=UPI003D6A692D
MTSTATSSRRDNVEGLRFIGPERLARNLQAILVDLIELHLQGKQAHWNLVGTNFRDLHQQLDEIIDTAREASDTIAERMRAVRAVPDCRSDTVSATTTLPTVPAGEVSTTDVVALVGDRLIATVATVRQAHDEVDADDPASADLLHAVIDNLEKYVWMVSAEHQQA